MLYSFDFIESFLVICACLDEEKGRKDCVFCILIQKFQKTLLKVYFLILILFEMISFFFSRFFRNFYLNRLFLFLVGVVY